MEHIHSLFYIPLCFQFLVHTITPIISIDSRETGNNNKQAGAELCQAQDKLSEIAM